MKQILLSAACVLWAALAAGQVGNGVLFLSEPTIAFPATTVDSTSTIELEIVNDLAIDQTVLFSVIDAPFSLVDNTPITIAGDDTASVVLQFQPTTTGLFTGELEALGSVFGSATINFSGEGIQVVLDWTPESLVFDTTAIGQTNTQTLSLTSSGNGDGVISSIDISNPVFSVDSAASSFVIAEGTSADLAFVFAPNGAGNQTGTATLHTNDPNNPQITLDLNGTGISEVSGNICDLVWTAANSPYTLVGDVVVPAGCTLTLEAGTEVIGNDYDIEVFGSFFTNGEDGNEVVLSCGELLSHTAKEQMVLTHTNVTETNEFEFFDVDFRTLSDACESHYGTLDSLPSYLDSSEGSEYYLYENENSALGWYSEDFSDNLGQGWTRGWSNYTGSSDGGVSFQNDGNGYYGGYDYSDYDGDFDVRRDCCYNSDWFEMEMISPTFNVIGHSQVMISFSSRAEWWSDTRYLRSFVRFDGGDWMQIDEYTNLGGNWTGFNFNINLPDGTQSLEFRYAYRLRYFGRYWLDNFELMTNIYPGADVPVTAATATVAFASLSTGGIELHNSTYSGDFHSVNDSLSVVIDNSSIVANPSREKDSHGLGLYADVVEIESNNSSFTGHAIDGIHIESMTTDWTSTEDVIDDNGEDGMDVGDNSDLTIYGIEIWNNTQRGIAAGDGSIIDIDYARIDGNGSHGIDLEDGGSLDLDNSRLLSNGGQGIQSGSPTTLNHCNLAFNGGTGLVLTGNNFHTLNNSILWGNNETNYTQIDIGGGVISTSYSTVQGQSGYGVTGSGQFYWGEGVIEADPLFADDDLHLNTYSPCVDGGQPWLMDAHMPYGLGGVRADMGMYGGPDNAYWGGLALPDGASTLQAVEDTPQDQGNTVGLTFSSSFYDNSELVNNVTHYAFWRHFDPTGAPITDVADGNWELLGTMPSLSLNNYAYQAPTLGNTNAFGDFSSCYFVAAHTDDDDTYWISNVVCGESVDNLAPEEPELNGLVLETGAAQLFWPEPAESDYAYTEIFSDAGFAATISADTLVTDAAAPAGAITYTAVHYDVNGNASDAASVTLDIGVGTDVIPLKAGWNLVSLDRSPVAPAVADVFSGLEPGNLQYVTSFDGGVQFYDPNGLSFLNSLTTLSDYQGYWVKVAADDTLEVSGSALNGATIPALSEGWNLVGYAGAADVAPADHFAAEIAADNLLYVTGFDAGFSYFDPNGLPFLNSLAALRNGFGYWVKVATGTQADENGLTTQPHAEVPVNPSFMVVNGVAPDLVFHDGEQVEVLNASGQTLATLPLLPTGHLMTTAIFGADGTSGQLGGAQPGETLRFAFRGALAAETLTFDGAMKVAHLTLTFPEATPALTVFPNPTSGPLTLSADLDRPGVLTADLRDMAGRQVAAFNFGTQRVGKFTTSLTEASILPAGTYELRLMVDGEFWTAQPVIKLAP